MEQTYELLVVLVCDDPDTPVLTGEKPKRYRPEQQTCVATDADVSAQIVL